jgi:hypothetical protein
MLLINADAFGIDVSSVETVGQCQDMFAVGGAASISFSCVLLLWQLWMS